MRFTSDNYDPNQLHNKFANLTNACINKENLGSEQANNLDVFEGVEFSTKVVLDGGKMSSDDFAKATSAEEYTIIGNMWYSR